MRIRVMTFNIRFDTVMDEPSGNRWADRVDSVVETVRRWRPDIVGFQEALRSQLQDLTAALPRHRAVGRPREAGDVGEYVPLFFDQERFFAQDYGDFWLSDTPDVEGSLGWDAPDPRHCTWALLADEPSGQRFAVFNTHLDRWGELARLEGARLIATRTQLTPGVPFLVMGDLNAGEDSEPLKAFRAAGLVDTYRRVHPHHTYVGTMHNYALPTPGEKIDFILADSSWTTAGADIIRDEAAGRLPSDHFPVFADVELASGARRSPAQEASIGHAAGETLASDH
ncbi:MAG: endonuclease [Nitriliruptorales bacterium]|nr:endonuclease [Nitriliruptorales bacterium]